MDENREREITGRELSASIRQSDQEILHYEIIYPVIKAENAVEKKINRVHEAGAKNFERLIKSRYLSVARRQFRAIHGYGAFYPVEISASFQVMKNSGGLFSLFNDTYFQLRHNGYKMSRTSKTYDMITGSALLLPQLFKHRSLFRQSLIRELRAKIEEEDDKTPGCYFSDWGDIFQHKISDSGYYLTEEGIVIYFQPETIAGLNAGMPSFMIPYGVFSGGMRFGL